MANNYAMLELEVKLLKQRVEHKATNFLRMLMDSERRTYDRLEKLKDSICKVPCYFCGKEGCKSCMVNLGKIECDKVDTFAHSACLKAAKIKQGGDNA